MSNWRDLDLCPWRAQLRRRARLRIGVWCLIAALLGLALGACLSAWLSSQRKGWEGQVDRLAGERLESAAGLVELSALEHQRALLGRRQQAFSQWLAERDHWVELWAALSALGGDGLRLERIERRGGLVRLEAKASLSAANLALARLGGLPQVSSARLLEHRPGAEGGWCRLELELAWLVVAPAPRATGQEADG